MNTKETDMYKLKARQSMLEKQFRDIRNRALGRDASFLPFVSDTDGRLSEVRLADFIDELVSGVVSGPDGGSYREMCECFLYCAVRGISEYNEQDKYPVRNAETFTDIVDIALHSNNLHLTDMETLADYEYAASMHDCIPGGNTFWNEFNDGGFFRSCDLAFCLLTGRDITATLPHERYISAVERYELAEAKIYGFDTVEEYHDYMEKTAEGTQEELEINSEELPPDSEYASTDDWEENDAEIIEIQNEKRKEWVNAFGSPESFVQKYLRFRELFFNVDIYHRCRLFSDVELMADYFLYSHGMSCLSDSGEFAGIYYRINRLASNMSGAKAGER